MLNRISAATAFVNCDILWTACRFAVNKNLTDHLETMPTTYDKLGLTFLYPENWKLFDETDATPHVVTLEAPEGSATWAVHAYPENADQNAILKETIDTLGETYEDLEISPLGKAIGQFDGEGVEAMFYCLDFLVKAKLQFFKTGQQLLLVWTQAEDRDFAKLDMIFQAISVSLLRPSE